MKLPFLKRRRMPRIGTDEPEAKLINYSSEDLLDDHAVGELMAAVTSKDPRAFLAAIEALVMNCFEDGEEDAA